MLVSFLVIRKTALARVPFTDQRAASAIVVMKRKRSVEARSGTLEDRGKSVMRNMQRNVMLTGQMALANSL